MAINIKEFGNKNILTTAYADSVGLDENAFCVDFLKKHNLITNQKSGRGQVFFFQWKPVKAAQTSNFEPQAKTYALRHYRRGGLVAKLSEDAFIYRGLKNTRCYQELYVLDFLQRNNVHVPTPIAGMVIRKGGFYCADLITEVIQEAIELHEQLKSNAIDSTLWYEIGAEIKKMHDLNVCHEDINVKNILLQRQDAKSKVYLIDFDKCFIKQQGKWKESNLARFRRSLDKHRRSYAKGAFTEVNWQTLLQGYQSH